MIPLLTIFIIERRSPVIPTLIFINILGAVLAIFVQGDSVGQIMQTMADGFARETGNATVDSLLQAGGISSMLGTIALLIIATSLGGILEETRSEEHTSELQSSGH